MTRTHWLLAALAAADFLRATFVMVFVGVSGAAGVWFGGDIWCKVGHVRDIILLGQNRG